MVGFHQGFQIVGRDKDQRVGFTVCGGHAHVHVVIGGVINVFKRRWEENINIHDGLLSEKSYFGFGKTVGWPIPPVGSDALVAPPQKAYRYFPVLDSQKTYQTKEIGILSVEER